MQFSRKFMISSVLVLVMGFAFWQLGANSEAAEESVQVEDSEKSEKQSKTDRAFESLNRKTGGKETPITVEAAPVERGTLIQRVSAQGRVFSYQNTTVINEVAGRLISLKVRDGDFVKKGQVIALIDDTEYKLDLEEAERNYLAAQAEYVTFDESLSLLDERKEETESAGTSLEDLTKQYKDGLISREDYDRQKFELSLRDLRSGNRQAEVLEARLLGQAKISLEKARLTVAKCEITAPFDGIIFDIKASEGFFLNPSTEIARLVNMDNLVVKAKVLESELGQIRTGRPAAIDFTALPEVGTVPGTVQAVSPFINEEDKTVETVVKIKGSPEGIRPGMFAEVLIDARMYEDRLMVPKTAILPRENRLVIFKVSEDNRAKWIYVETGVGNDEFVEVITDELEPGEMVLTDNHFTMGHDTLVKIAKSK